MTSIKDSPIRLRFATTAAVCFGMLCMTSTALATTFVKGLVPDWNQPYWHGAHGPNGGPVGGPAGPWQAWCTPTAAANVIGYWEDKRGHAISDGAVYPASGRVWPQWPAWQDYEANGGPSRGMLSPVSADDIGWYFDTNHTGDPAHGNGAHLGTYIKDVSRPAWNAKLGLNKFFNDRGAVGFRARTLGVGYADGGLPVLGDLHAWQQITLEIDANRPIMVAFKHWNIITLNQTRSDTSPEGSLGWSYWNFGAFGGDPWGNGEYWDPNEVGPQAVGHYVTAVGYIIANTADDILGNTNWVIVHDTVGQTPRNVAVPFVHNLVPWLANTTIRGYTSSPYVFGPPETIDNTSADTGHMVSLKLDQDNNPQVAYEDLTNNIVKYAKKSGGVWTRESVDAVNARCWGISIAVSWNRWPSIAWAGAPDLVQAKDLWYAGKNSFGNWLLTKVYDATSSGNEVYFPAIVLNPSGNPQIAYKRGMWDLWLSYYSAGWNHTHIDTTGTAISTNHNAIEIDNNGYLHIAYNDAVSSGIYNVERLKYAQNRCNPGVWQTQVVESFAGSTNYGVGDYPSIDLNSQGWIIISHYAGGQGQLRTAQRGDVCSMGVWINNAVDPNISQGSTAVCYDSADRPVIAYWGTAPGIPSAHACIKLARYTSAGWVIQTVYDPGSSSTPVYWLSMDLDQCSRPRIAFYGPESTSLRYIVAQHRGDIDGDGSLSLDDQTLLTNVLLDPTSATDEQRRAADCNGDGVLDGRDIQAFIALMLG
ncbi:MAG TPA: dockerin type I repeat-containing protein [Phycisphaerae bacterium]|nr:dockerin type I repeat-containing protein [Phycisphaerae bacterium]